MEKEEILPVKLPGRIYDEIERTVVTLYIDLNLTSSPIDPFEIARNKGYVLKKFSELGLIVKLNLKRSECDGFSFFNSTIDTFIIYYDDSMPVSRQKFTIMHEIGHILLGHKEESRLANIMANYFAAYSLAPSPLIAFYNCEDFVDVERVFCVSPDCAEISFSRFNNWLLYGGSPKQYEIMLVEIYKNQKGVDAYECYLAE